MSVELESRKWALVFRLFLGILAIGIIPFAVAGLNNEGRGENWGYILNLAK